MSEINDGGPAFPAMEEHEEWCDEAQAYRKILLPAGGMSQRDYFAAKALQGFCAQSHNGPKDWAVMGHGYGEDACNELNRHSRVLSSCLADWAYALADEMLRAREAK